MMIAHTSPGGSAMLKPLYGVTALDGIKELAKAHGIEVEYAPGVIASRYLPVLNQFAASPSGSREPYDVTFYSEEPTPTSKPTLEFTVNSSSGCLVS